jgi:hypothetical protein
LLYVQGSALLNAVRAGQTENAREASNHASGYLESQNLRNL